MIPVAHRRLDSRGQALLACAIMGDRGGVPGGVVIIGAGCIGAAIAWELARRGVRDVTVLEKEPFAGAGSTGKAAGGIRAQFSTPVNVRISMLAVRRYQRFAEELETEPVYFPVGYLFLLSDPPRWEAFQRQVEMQRGLGLE